jgi:hypothetical protein
LANFSPNPGDVDEPLVIDREKLVEVLQGNLTEEQNKRIKAEDDRMSNRQEIAAEIRAWSDDELVNFFTRNVNVMSKFDFLEWSARVRESGQFKSAETKPTERETSLEKYVRVLNLASNSTISVKPHDEVYPLL